MPIQIADKIVDLGAMKILTLLSLFWAMLASATPLESYRILRLLTPLEQCTDDVSPAVAFCKDGPLFEEPKSLKLPAHGLLGARNPPTEGICELLASNPDRMGHGPTISSQTGARSYDSGENVMPLTIASGNEDKILPTTNQLNTADLIWVFENDLEKLESATEVPLSTSVTTAKSYHAICGIIPGRHRPESLFAHLTLFGCLVLYAAFALSLYTLGITFPASFFGKRCQSISTNVHDGFDALSFKRQVVPAESFMVPVPAFSPFAMKLVGLLFRRWRTDGFRPMTTEKLLITFFTSFQSSQQQQAQTADWLKMHEQLRDIAPHVHPWAVLRDRLKISGFHKTLSSPDQHDLITLRQISNLKMEQAVVLKKISTSKISLQHLAESVPEQAQQGVAPFPQSEYSSVHSIDLLPPFSVIDLNLLKITLKRALQTPQFRKQIYDIIKIVFPFDSCRSKLRIQDRELARERSRQAGQEHGQEKALLMESHRAELRSQSESIEKKWQKELANQSSQQENELQEQCSKLYEKFDKKLEYEQEKVFSAEGRANRLQAELDALKRKYCDRFNLTYDASNAGTPKGPSMASASAVPLENAVTAIPPFSLPNPDITASTGARGTYTILSRPAAATSSTSSLVSTPRVVPQISEPGKVDLGTQLEALLDHKRLREADRDRKLTEIIAQPREADQVVSRLEEVSVCQPDRLKCKDKSETKKDAQIAELSQHLEQRQSDLNSKAAELACANRKVAKLQAKLKDSRRSDVQIFNVQHNSRAKILGLVSDLGHCRSALAAMTAKKEDANIKIAVLIAELEECQATLNAKAAVLDTAGKSPELDDLRNSKVRTSNSSSEARECQNEPSDDGNNPTCNDWPESEEIMAIDVETEVSSPNSFHSSPQSNGSLHRRDSHTADHAHRTWPSMSSDASTALTELTIANDDGLKEDLAAPWSLATRTLSIDDINNPLIKAPTLETVGPVSLITDIDSSEESAISPTSGSLIERTLPKSLSMSQFDMETQMIGEEPGWPTPGFESLTEEPTDFKSLPLNMSTMMALHEAELRKRVPMPPEPAGNSLAISVRCKPDWFETVDALPTIFDDSLRLPKPGQNAHPIQTTRQVESEAAPPIVFSSVVLTPEAPHDDKIAVRLPGQGRSKHIKRRGHGLRKASFSREAF